MFFERRAESIATRILALARESIAAAGLDSDRLPGWTRAANVKIGWINDSLVMIFDDAPEHDDFRTRGKVNADTVLLFDLEDFTPDSYIFPSGENIELITYAGHTEEQSSTSLIITGQPSALLSCGLEGAHGPVAISTMPIIATGKSQDIVLGARIVSCAFYIHRKDAVDIRSLWARCQATFIGSMKAIHDSTQGDYFCRHRATVRSHLMTHQDGVLVLGSFAKDEIGLLRDTRDYLRMRGWDAYMITDLAEIAHMTNEQKARFWMMTSRWCVMVDRSASGHIAEYQLIKENRNTLALLRPLGSGSTWMIGDEELHDVNFIKTFRFGTSPLEVLDDAATWCESFLETRTKTLNQHYPWRRRTRGPS
jgi:hypothetical protein